MNDTHPLLLIVVIVILLFYGIGLGVFAHQCKEAGGEVASYRDWICVKKGSLIHTPWEP